MLLEFPVGHREIDLSLAPVGSLFHARFECSDARSIISRQQPEISISEFCFHKGRMSCDQFLVKLLSFIKITLLLADPSELVLKIAPLRCLFYRSLERDAGARKVADFLINST